MGGQEKEWMGCLKKKSERPGRPQSFRHQRRPVDDCSPRRVGMAQNGGTRGGTFHGEMDRSRESQGWTTASSRMPERDGKDQEECSVDLKPGDCEMVVDGGGHFSPASYRWCTQMSLLLSSSTAHSRAVGNPHTHNNQHK